MQQDVESHMKNLGTLDEASGPIFKLTIDPRVTKVGRSKLFSERWLELDLQYIDTWSFDLDLKTLLNLVPTVFSGVSSGKGAS